MMDSPLCTQPYYCPILQEKVRKNRIKVEYIFLAISNYIELPKDIRTAVSGNWLHQNCMKQAHKHTKI